MHQTWQTHSVLKTQTVALNHHMSIGYLIPHFCSILFCFVFCFLIYLFVIPETIYFTICILTPPPFFSECTPLCAGTEQKKRYWVLSHYNFMCGNPTHHSCALVCGNEFQKLKVCDTVYSMSKTCLNGSQLAKMKKSIPDLSLP